MRPWTFVLAIAVLLTLEASHNPVYAATFTVINTNDSGLGSLRQAIMDANANANAGIDTIGFNIPGSGPHTIQPLSAMPSITDSVVIDGYTQPGASPNTSGPGIGTNAVLQIEVDGSMAATGPPPPSVHGFVIVASSAVRGLVINRFATGDGIRLSAQFGGIGGEGGNVVEGNFIGTDITGTVALGNNRAVTIFNPDNTIGGRVPEARNVLSGNESGVWIQDDLAIGNRIEGNFIGTAADGTSPLGNAFDGVIITRGGPTGAADNFLGGIASGAGNTIAFNGRVGVFIQMGSVRNAILSNSIFSNGDLGIDLNSPFGVTPNDPGDGDSGPNNLQNFPVLTAATSGSTSVQGTLNSAASTEFRLEFYSNAVCDPSHFGEGENFLGSTDVTTDSSGNAVFMVTFPTAVSEGQFITSTAIDPSNNTSEFSRCQLVVPPAAMSISKTSTTQLITAAGELVPYNYVIRNTGQATLHDVALTDDNVDAPPVCRFSGNDELLPAGAPGSIVACEAEHTATLQEIAAEGTLDNTATSTSDETPPVMASLSIPIGISRDGFEGPACPCWTLEDIATLPLFGEESDCVSDTSRIDLTHTTGCEYYHRATFSESGLSCSVNRFDCPDLPDVVIDIDTTDSQFFTCRNQIVTRCEELGIEPPPFP